MATKEQWSQAWSNLSLLDYQVWDLVHGKGGREDLSSWYGTLIKKIGECQARLLEAFSRNRPEGWDPPGTHSITWSPVDRETYDVADAVASGKVPGDLPVPLSKAQEVLAWKPIPVMQDCESCQGWIYCAPEHINEVLRRIAILDPGANPSAEIQPRAHWNPPRDWKAKMGWQLHGKGKRLKLKVPQPVAAS